MARCTNCNYKWKTKDVWLLGFTKKGKVCPVCNTRQFLAFKDRGFLLGLGYLSGTIAILIIIFSLSFLI
ncbi:hypothetical protein [Oceanobacillus neutriphilus]|uniref:CXXC-20-CXXC protein n=1 Tax=Oceanobacillus neutriphilus TaxID=531815 RepID=A0ABQ2NRK2_9BACI|nr:hypothetical protein [Oceanobacillus neutriphilus]GGP09102.1 hypothetical protein GCM10011346_11810 [Oceanobacillus neutriphilus]